MGKSIKTHLKPALGASGAAPGVVYTQTPISDERNGGAKDAHNGAADSGGSRSTYRVAIHRPGTRGTGPLPH